MAEENVRELRNYDPRIDEMAKAIKDMITARARAQSITYAEIIGTLEIVKNDLYQELRDA